MKILKILLILFFIPAICHGGIVIGDYYEDACITTTGDEMYESFGDDSTACYSGATGDDATCIETWAVTGDSQTFHHALQAGMPTGACTYGVLSDTSNEPGEIISWDNGSAIATTNDIDINFTFYSNSATVDSGTTIYALAWSSDSAGATRSFGFYIKNNAGTYEIKAYGLSSNGITLANSTWYDITIHLDGLDSSACYIQIVGGGNTNCDAVDECAFTRTTTAGRYLVIGSVANEGSGEAVNFEIGNVNINTP